MTVVQPNEDGSYWRKIVRNKMVTNPPIAKPHEDAMLLRTTSLTPSGITGTKMTLHYHLLLLY